MFQSETDLEEGITNPSADNEIKESNHQISAESQNHNKND